MTRPKVFLCMAIIILPVMVLAQTQGGKRFGLTEEQRIQVYKEYLDINSRAAEETWPTAASAIPEEYLRPGNTAKLTRNTPLMPVMGPTDPRQALLDSRILTPGLTIIVKEVAKKGDSPWYRVNVNDARGSMIATGWINSVALTGQIKPPAEESSDARGDREERLVKKYRRELAKKYHITTNQLEKIIDEAPSKWMKLLHERGQL